MSLERKETVSLCMIVRNEAHQLAECLEPVATLFDDIVIVDTGSQDRTRTVAERFTSQVFDFAWCDDFSAARNEALRHARGSWIFWLDADDRLSAANVARLRELIAGLTDRPQGFLMQTLLHLDPEARDRLRVATHLRLFRRHPAIRWRRRVHEQLIPWPAAIGHELVATNIEIDHLGYQDATLTQRKLRRNIRLLRMEYVVSPDDPSILTDLGTAYAQLGKAAECRQFLRAVIPFGRQSPYLLRRAMTTLGELENATGNAAEAEKVLRCALQHFPGDDYLLYMHSEALYNLGRYSEAKAALVKILESPPHAPCMQIGVPSDIRTRLARLALGEVHRVQFARSEAEQVLLGVVADFPSDAGAWYFLGRVYVDWHQWQRLDVVIDRLARCPGGDIFAALLTATGQYARADFRSAEQALEGLIAKVPYMLLPRTLRAECLKCRHAPLTEQLQAYRDVLRVQPQNPLAREMTSRLQEALAHSAKAAPTFATSAVLSGGVIESGMPGAALH